MSNATLIANLTRFVSAKCNAQTFLRGVLNSRTEKCSEGCKGYVPADNGIDLARCDECASLNGYADLVFDEDFWLLPEARRDAAEWLREANEACEECEADLCERCQERCPHRPESDE